MNHRARLTLSAFLLFVSTTALTAAPVRVSRQDHSGRTVLLVNGMPALSVAHSGGSSQRGATVLARLEGLAQRGGTSVFRVEKAGPDYLVLANGRPLVTPSHTDVLLQKSSRRALAHRWAAHLTEAWNTPFLKLSPGGLVVGVGSAKRLTIGGAARGPVSVRVEPSGPAAARLENGTVVLTGKAPGRGTVVVSRDGASARTAFLVMKPAGTVRPVSIDVTGRRIPDTLLDGILDAEMRRSIQLEPGCWSVVKSRPGFPELWTRGDRLTRKVTVRLAGPGYLATTREIPVRVNRVRLPRQDDVTLFYSNNPESVTEPRVLFRHPVRESSPVRLLYHHQNRARTPLDLSIDLVNTGGSEARVQVVDGTAPASVDTVLAGHKAAYKFLKRSLDEVGVIVRIPAGGRRRLWTRTMSSGVTLSGLMLVRPMGQETINLTVAAEDPRGLVATVRPPGDTEAVFPNPDKSVDAHYRVGGPWAHVPIGRFAIANESGKRLSGNYGVLYTVRLHLENPTSARRNVRVIFEAQAGAARGVFLIDGELTETPETHPPAETRVATMSLAPLEKRTLTIITMPAAGSAYPAGLIVNAQ